MARTELNIANLDKDSLKQYLIEFLESTGKFGDFDFEGSAINTLIDLLVRNDLYNGFMASMMANESFIQSAQIRGNVVSSAQKLSYEVRSRTASRLICDIVVKAEAGGVLPNVITMPKGTAFSGTVAGKTYNFTNNEDYTLTLNPLDNTYSIKSVLLYQGVMLRERFEYQGDKIVISNLDCDRSTVKVFVHTDNTPILYEKATSIETLASDTECYFVSERFDQRTEIAFGKNVLGREPNINALVDVYYINVESEHANGLRDLSADQDISGHTDIAITVTLPAFGGLEREDIEDIRFLAPRRYEAQDRCLNPQDYTILIKERFPFLQSVISWGGETNIPPVYGVTFVALLPQAGEEITDALTREIVAYLAPKAVGSITPRILTPLIFNIDLLVSFSYDDRKTNKTFNDLTTEINQVVSKYNQDELYKFGLYYNNSKLSALLSSINGIDTLNIEKTVSYTFDVVSFKDPTYIIEFDNEIEEGSISMSDFSISPVATNHSMYDSGGSLFIKYEISGVPFTEQVGTVDYQTGYIEFTLNIIEGIQTVTVTATPIEDNFYVRQNRVAAINRVETAFLSVKDRNVQIYERF